MIDQRQLEMADPPWMDESPDEGVPERYVPELEDDPIPLDCCPKCGTYLADCYGKDECPNCYADEHPIPPDESLPF